MASSLQQAVSEIRQSAKYRLPLVRAHSQRPTRAEAERTRTSSCSNARGSSSELVLLRAYQRLEVVALLEVGEQSGVHRLPAHQLLSQRVRGWIVH